MLALAISVAAAGFTGWQAFEANRANNEEDAAQAGNVYFDFTYRIGTAGEFSVVNRNQQPVTNVVYTYAIGGSDSGNDVYVGTIPGCAAVALTPQDPAIGRGAFKPVDLFFTDPNGESWKRDKGNKVTNSEAREERPERPRTVGIVTPITTGCRETN